MKQGTNAKKPLGAMVHVVALETAFAWCGRKTEKMEAVDEPATCFVCIAKGVQWRREWPRL